MALQKDSIYALIEERVVQICFVRFQSLFKFQNWQLEKLDSGVRTTILGRPDPPTQLVSITLNTFSGKKKLRKRES
jgi:hypothetical protein